jgi:hypothetical protein
MDDSYLLGFANTHLLRESSSGALNGAILALSSAQFDETFLSNKIEGWTEQNIASYGKRVVELSASSRAAVINSYCSAAGVTEIGEIDQEAAHFSIFRSIVVPQDALLTKTGMPYLPRTTEALAVACLAPSITPLMQKLSSNTEDFKAAVNSFNKLGYGVEMLADTNAAIGKLPAEVKTLIDGIKSISANDQTAAFNLIASKVQSYTGQLSTGIAQMRSITNDSAQLISQFRQNSASLQTYSAALGVASTLFSAAGNRELAQNLTKAASFIQQTYGAYQMVAAGCMGPIGAISLLAAAPSLLDGGLGGGSKAAEQQMFTAILNELREMRKEIRERLVNIDKKLDHILGKLENIYEAVSSGNRTALQNFAEIKDDIRFVLSEIEGTNREELISKFRSCREGLITALETDDNTSYRARMTEIYAHASIESRRTFFVGRSFQPEGLQAKAARYPSAELMIGASSQVCSLAGLGLDKSDAPNPVEWSRGAMTYIEALQAKPDVEINRTKTDLTSLWNDGRAIKSTIGTLTSPKMMARLALALAKGITGRALNSPSVAKMTGDADLGASPEPNAPDRSLEDELNAALKDYEAKFYGAPDSQKPVPTRTGRGMGGRQYTVHDHKKSGRFYYDPSDNLDQAFRYDNAEDDPILRAVAAGVIEIQKVREHRHQTTVWDGDNHDTHWHTIKVLKGPDKDRVFGVVPPVGAIPGVFEALTKVSQREPNLNGEGNWWHWPKKFPNERFQDTKGLVNYVRRLYCIQEPEQTAGQVVNWLLTSKFSPQAVPYPEVLTKCFELATAFRLCASFVQWRLRSIEGAGAITAPGFPNLQNALTNIDIPSSADEIASIFYSTLLAELNRPELPAWHDLSESSVKQLSKLIVEDRIVPYWQLSRQIPENQSVPVVDATLRQLATIMKLRGIDINVD